MAAENYAKATNHLGVALVTTGPGGTNAITGLAGAWLDSTPVLFISGQVKRPDRMFAADGTPLGMRQLGVQEVDIVSIVKPITKYAVTVLDPADHSLPPGEGRAPGAPRASRTGVDRYSARRAGRADRRRLCCRDSRPREPPVDDADSGSGRTGPRNDSKRSTGPSAR